MARLRRLRRRDSVTNLRVASIMWENMYTGPSEDATGYEGSFSDHSYEELDFEYDQDEGEAPPQPMTSQRIMDPRERRRILTNSYYAYQPLPPLSPLSEVASLPPSSPSNSPASSISGWSLKTRTTGLTSEESPSYKSLKKKNALGLVSNKSDEGRFAPEDLRAASPDGTEEDYGSPVSTTRQLINMASSSSLRVRLTKDRHARAASTSSLAGIERVESAKKRVSRRKKSQKDGRPIFVYGDLADPLLLSLLLTGSADNVKSLNREPARLYGFENRLLQMYNYPVIVRQERRLSPSTSPRSSPISNSTPIVPSLSSPYVDGFLIHSLTPLQRRRIKHFYPTFISEPLPPTTTTDKPRSPVRSQSSDIMFKRTKAEVTVPDQFGGLGYDVKADVYLIDVPEDMLGSSQTSSSVSVSDGMWDLGRFRKQSLDMYLTVFEGI